MLLQEAVPFGPVVDENGLKAGFDAGDEPLVDVALGDLPRRAFDPEIFQPAVFDRGDAAFPGIAGVDQDFGVHK